LQLKFNIPRFLRDNIYLLLSAAWLITISFIIDNYWSATSSLQTIQARLQDYIDRSEKDFESTLKDSAFIHQLRSGDYDERTLNKFIERDYFLFFYQKDPNGQPELVRWNTPTVIPDLLLLRSTNTTGFVFLANGYYAWKKGGSVAEPIIALIPVKWNYFVTNEYLKNDYVSDSRISHKYDLVPGPGKDGEVRSGDGQALFHLVPIFNATDYKNNIVSVWFRLIAVFLVLWFIHMYASYLAQTIRFHKAAVFLVITIFLLRFLSYYFPIPLNFRQFELFDPTIYGSNLVLRSLGDLLINAVLFLWVITFIRYHVYEKKIRFEFSDKRAKWFMLAAGSLLLIISTFTGANIIRSLISDSQISFDVINFFSLNIYSVIGFLVLCCIAIGYFFLCQVILYLLKPLFPKPFYDLFIAITSTALLMLSFKVGTIDGGFEIYVLIWLLLFLFLLNYEKFNLLASRVVTSKMVFWLFFFSVSISSVIIMENNRKELMNRHHYAEILATKSDPASETLLNSMLTDFRVDYLADNFFRLRDERSNHFFKDSLINNNFSGYTDKYDTRILTFNHLEEPLHNIETSSYNQLNSILNTQAKPTSIPTLFYYDEAYDKFSYISKKIIVDTGRNLIGYVFILVNPKNFKNDNLYPELFSKGHANAIENSSAYAFAVYSNGKLISSHNDYPFATKLPANFFSGQQYLHVDKNNHNELWYNAGANKYVVIAKENSLSIESITLFSYLFCSFLVLTALFWLINMIVRSKLRVDKLKAYLQLTVRNQIHGTIIFFSVVSFLVIGIATILFFITRYENTNREKLSSTIRIMEKDVKATFTPEMLESDTFKLSEPGYKSSFEQTISKISEIHGIDVNIYDLEGNLKLSSLPLPYSKGILSTKMEPVAYYHLNKLNEVQFFQKEHIGDLHFLSNYVPVIDANGDEYAYLNIPYFTSQSKLQAEIANFLVTIINLNAFIFLVAGIVALFITNRITNSFSLIGEKMKMVNLGTRNEAIEWERKDEIGELVNEYNKMVSKLDESAEALAKTEREGAWREMARQVAHEIKNPLTPMKLSMQFLQKSIENDSPNVRQLTANVANTLVEQIDHLSKIASEFSQFANIEHANKERLDLNESLHSIAQLYSGDNRVQINWDLEPGPVHITADRTHINRLFTNLIQNGIQAAEDHTSPVIHVSELVSGNKVLIEMKDNGSGIDEEVQEKIFTPNFTTKTSGTGLGLAMCKRIVEQSGGDIYFKTAKGEGTSFFVEFPLA